MSSWRWVTVKWGLSLGVIALFGLIIWVCGEYRLNEGPRAVIADRSGEGLVLALADAIVILDGRGTPERHPYAALGIEGPVTALAWHPDGGLLAGDEGARSLLRCSLQDAWCIRFPRGDIELGNDEGGDIEILLSEAGDELVIADTWNDRLLRLDLFGELIADSAGGILHFKRPQSIARLGDDVLVVADTDHQRVVAVGLEEEGFGAGRWHFETHSGERRRSRNDPIAVATDAENRWWMLKGNPYCVDGIDLLRFSPSGIEGEAVALPPGSAPVHLITLGERMLVAGYDPPALYALDRAGRLEEGFETRVAGGLLEEMRRERERLRGVEKVVWWGLPSMLILLTLVILFEPRDSAELVPDRMGDEEIHWFPKEPNVLAKFRQLRRMVLLLTLVVAGLAFAGTMFLPMMDWQLLFVFHMPAMMMVALAWGAVDVERERLGILADGRVALVDHRGRLQVGSIQELMRHERVVALGNVVVGTRFGTGESIYLENEMLTRFYPLLAGTRQSSYWWMLRAMFGRHPSMGYLSALILTLFALAVVQ